VEFRPWCSILKLFQDWNCYISISSLFLAFWVWNGCAECWVVQLLKWWMVQRFCISNRWPIFYFFVVLWWLMYKCVLSSCLRQDILFFLQAFWRTPQKPFRQVCNHSLMVDLVRKLYYCVAEVLCILGWFWSQRLYMVKPCPKELKCDVEVSLSCWDLLMYSNAREFDAVLFQVSSYAIRDAEEYKNFCDRPKDQRPLPEEVIGVSLKVLYR